MLSLTRPFGHQPRSRRAARMPLLASLPMPLVPLRIAGSEVPPLMLPEPMFDEVEPDIVPPAAPGLPGVVLPALLVLIVPLLVMLPGVVVGPGVARVTPLVLPDVVPLVAARPGVVVDIEPGVPGVVVFAWDGLLPGVAVLPVLPVELLVPLLVPLPVVCA